MAKNLKQQNHLEFLFKKMQISGSCLNLPESKYRVETKDLQIVRWLRGKESACQCRRHGFNPLVRRFLGEGSGNHLQYSCLGNPMEEPGRLQSIRWQKVGQDLVSKQLWSISVASVFSFRH